MGNWGLLDPEISLVAQWARLFLFLYQIIKIKGDILLNQSD